MTNPLSDEFLLELDDALRNHESSWESEEICERHLNKYGRQIHHTLEEAARAWLKHCGSAAPHQIKEKKMTNLTPEDINQALLALDNLTYPSVLSENLRDVKGIDMVDLRAIRQSLRLAKAVMGEPSGEMLEAAADFHANGKWSAADDDIWTGVFKAMRDQLIKETKEGE